MLNYDKAWSIFITSWVKSNFDQQILSELGVNVRSNKKIKLASLMKPKRIRKNPQLAYQLNGDEIISSAFVDYYSLALVNKQLYRCLLGSGENRMSKMIAAFLRYQYELETSFFLEYLLSNLIYFNPCSIQLFESCCFTKSLYESRMEKKLVSFILKDNTCDRVSILLMRCKIPLIVSMLSMSFALLSYSFVTFERTGIMAGLIILYLTLMSCWFTCYCCSVIDCHPTARRMESRLINHAIYIMEEGMALELIDVDLVSFDGKEKSLFSVLLENLLNVDKPIQPSAETGNPKEDEDALTLSGPMR